MYVPMYNVYSVHVKPIFVVYDVLVICIITLSSNMERSNRMRNNIIYIIVTYRIGILRTIRTKHTLNIMSSRIAMNLAQCSNYVRVCVCATDGTRMFLERKTLFLHM
jgi:hypothetical protein